MYRSAITGSGVFTPREIITNEELVISFNAYVDRFNEQNAHDIENGTIEAKAHSSTEFIEKASGIRQRHVLNKAGVLDIDLMHPRLKERNDDAPSAMAEMALQASETALHQANCDAKDIDAIIVAASNHERAYPAIAIEVQHLLGMGGFAFDMNVACSSATFGIQLANDMIRTGSVERILVVSPEICSAHLEWRDRDCHFIFGDVATALLIERDDALTKSRFEILSTACETQYSNNIRNNNGFLRRTREGHMEDRRDMLFMQKGRRVFKDVVPWVSDHALTHLGASDIDQSQLDRIWLHQANLSMNELIGRKILGRDPELHEMPNILENYANTSSAGSIVAFSQYSADLSDGAFGLICSFGAGYSVGSVILRKSS